MEKQRVARSKIAVPVAGGNVSIVSADGKVRFTVGLAGGLHGTEAIVALMRPDETIKLATGLALVEPDNPRARRVEYGPGATDSGANPDFQPQRISDVELRLRKLVQEVSGRANGLEKRIAALQNAKAAVPPPVEADPVPDPAPAKPADASGGAAE